MADAAGGAVLYPSSGPAMLWEPLILVSPQDADMSRTCLILVPGLLSVLCSPATSAEPVSTFELRDGDRVVLVGGTLIEREQSYGDWEAVLTAAWPNRQIMFRNLGWSGDTVWGESRGMFEPEQGYGLLVEQVRAAEPTVLILAYGQNEAFNGPAGLDSFRQQYEKLLAEVAGDGVRCVFLAPLKYTFDTGRPETSPPLDEYNRSAELYGLAIRELAARRGDVFIDWTSRQTDSSTGELTDWVQIFSREGYRTTARWWLPHLKGEHVPALAEVLQRPDADRRLDPLRQAIVAKNDLFFHRWRPQNWTYLYGFREHEQGQNAAEVPRFVPLIEEVEREIADLKTFDTELARPGN